VDEITRLPGDVGEEIGQIIAFKKFDLAAPGAKQNVLVPVGGTQITMAAIRQVDALDEA